MKIFAIIIMLVSLFLLYRIAYPKQTTTRKRDDFPEKNTKKTHNVMGKSRFERSKPLQTPATLPKIENSEKKSNIFAPEIETRNAVIPPELLDEIFNHDELEIEPDENELKFGDNRDDWDSEALDETAEFEQGAELASGMSIEEMCEAAKAIESPTDEKANILFKVEKTDMFEQVVSGDEGKAAKIKAIIDRHFQSFQTEETESSENSDFDVSEFLGLTIKK